MTRIGKILHIEDDDEWRHHVEKLLGDDYWLFQANNLEEAAHAVIGLGDESFDVVIVDISLNTDNIHDKQGFLFVEAMDETGFRKETKVIVLSSYVGIDDNLHTAFRDLNVIEVFDKGNFADEKEKLKNLIAKSVLVKNQ